LRFQRDVTIVFTEGITKFQPPLIGGGSRPYLPIVFFNWLADRAGDSYFMSDVSASSMDSEATASEVLRYGYRTYSIYRAVIFIDEVKNWFVAIETHRYFDDLVPVIEDWVRSSLLDVDGELYRPREGSR
jgi:hypothetical protein